MRDKVVGINYSREQDLERLNKLGSPALNALLETMRGHILEFERARVEDTAVKSRIETYRNLCGIIEKILANRPQPSK